MSAPAMTFNVDELLDEERMRNGPMTLFWNQDGYIECNKPLPVGEPPKRQLRHRVLRVRPFRIDVRIAPPPDVDLTEWGVAIAKRLNVPWQDGAKEGDKAVWLPGWVFARNAGQALGSARRIFDRLGGLEVGQVQVRVVSALVGEQT